ncbi:MAG: Gfo/Idh/MocA family oxidoreductase [Gallionella sp.]|nr:Gfo/Idh/MocA family oxidoreductase [Gallionella sp.]
MKVLVVGTGSIGQRHISNLMHLGAEVAAFSYRAAEGAPCSSHAGMRLVENLHDALQEDFDGVVVANRTDLHMDVALEAARRKKNLLLEKPLSVSLAGCDELQALMGLHALVVEAGFMLRFHPNLVWIKQYLADGALGELMHLRASVGQWLPDWRPGTDHRTGYGAFRKTGGGVIFDLIHELDLVHWLAGAVVDVTAMTRHVDCLGIETEAIAQIGLRLESGALAQVHLDYVRPGYGRALEIVGSIGVLTWDYPTGTVSLSRADGSSDIVHRVPSEFDRNTMFREHMAYFLRRLSTPELKPSSSLGNAIEALQIALACHRSAEERQCIKPKEIDFHFKL